MIPNQISSCIRASFVLACCPIVFEAPNAFALEPAAQCGHASVLLKAIILGLFPVVSPLYFLVTGHGFTSCGLREQPHTENPIPIVYSKISCSFKLKLVKLSIIKNLFGTGCSGSMKSTHVLIVSLMITLYRFCGYSEAGLTRSSLYWLQLTNPGLSCAILYRMLWVLGLFLAWHQLPHLVCLLIPQDLEWEM
jgi:hypothetical protein